MGIFLRRSLKCLQVQRTEMQCCRCFHIKIATYLMPQMVTMLANGIVRLKCQDEVRKEGQVYAIAVAVGKDRGHKEKGLQTCRSKDCKRKWTKPSSAGAKRQRYCPACRKRWPFHLGQSALTGTNKLAAASGHKRFPGAAATRSFPCLCLLLPTGRKAKKYPLTWWQGLIDFGVCNMEIIHEVAQAVNEILRFRNHSPVRPCASSDAVITPKASCRSDLRERLGPHACSTAACLRKGVIPAMFPPWIQGVRPRFKRRPAQSHELYGPQTGFPRKKSVQPYIFSMSDWLRIPSTLTPRIRRPYLFGDQKLTLNTLMAVTWDRSNFPLYWNSSDRVFSGKKRSKMLSWALRTDWHFDIESWSHQPCSIYRRLFKFSKMGQNWY